MSIKTVDEILGQYGDELKAELIVLQKCQEERNQKSCSTCNIFFDCETRKKYVKTVYESMSHGETGGFEF